MAYRILHQGPSYTVAATDELGTMTDYPRVERHDGNINYGYIDLRNRPDLVDSIPEVRKSKALADLLRLINAIGSPLISIGCECAEFSCREPKPTGETLQVGGYVDLTYKDPQKSQSEAALVDVAMAILSRIEWPAPGVAIGFEMIVSPLKLLFGEPGHNGLMRKPIGYGNDSKEGWHAFDCATNAVEASLRPLIGLLIDPKSAP